MEVEVEVEVEVELELEVEVEVEVEAEVEVEEVNNSIDHEFAHNYQLIILAQQKQCENSGVFFVSQHHHLK